MVSICFANIEMFGQLGRSGPVRGLGLVGGGGLTALDPSGHVAYEMSTSEMGFLAMPSSRCWCELRERRLVGVYAAKGQMVERACRKGLSLK
jgi:hypothetical protein